MERKTNTLGIICAAAALLCLVGIIFGAKQHFFGFLTFAGLAYALLTEDPQDKKQSIN